MKAAIGLALMASMAAAPAAAQSAAFHPGPVIRDFGAVAAVEADAPIPPEARFAVSFDVATRAEPGKRSRQLESAARLLNMLAEAGVPPERVRIAIVVHGGAAFDLTRPEAYAARADGAANANAPLIAELVRHGVDMQLCGQSAAAHGIARADLLPGVRMALSAMTAHALLQQRGYTLNPF
jgi:intracellular sulfur oxidation DsrE/DsrF family protein